MKEIYKKSFFFIERANDKKWWHYGTNLKDDPTLPVDYETEAFGEKQQISIWTDDPLTAIRFDHYHEAQLFILKDDRLKIIGGTLDITKHEFTIN